MLKSFRKRMVMIRESIVMALDNIRSNKVRSFLTLLGIMIGVMAVITLISTVSGVSGTISSSFSSMGVGTLTVSVSGSDLKSGMTPEDLQVITDLENVDGVVPSISLNGRVSYGNDVQTGISVSGRNAYYFILNEEMIIQGRSLNFIDDDNSSYVCVISQEIVDEFFLGVNPIGETLYVSGLPFTIVGRYEEDSGGGVASIFSGSPAVMIPYTTAMKVNNSTDINSFTVYLKEGADSTEAKQEIEDAMDVLFDFEEDCFTVSSMESIEETMNTMTTMLSSLYRHHEHDADHRDGTDGRDRPEEGAGRRAGPDPDAVPAGKLPAFDDRRPAGSCIRPGAILRVVPDAGYELRAERRRHYPGRGLLRSGRYHLRLGTCQKSQPAESH